MLSSLQIQAERIAKEAGAAKFYPEHQRTSDDNYVVSAGFLERFYTAAVLEANYRLFDIMLDDDGQAWKEARKYLERAVPELYAELERRESLRGNSPSAAQEGVPSDAMVDAYLQAQRRAVEDADQFGRPNIGGLHSNTVRKACRAGLKAALAAAPQPVPSAAAAVPKRLRSSMACHLGAGGAQLLEGAGRNA